MPFHSHARIVVENGTGRVVDAFYYNIDLVQLDRLAPGATTFHAWWHREPSTSDRRAAPPPRAGRGGGRDRGAGFWVGGAGVGCLFLEGGGVFAPVRALPQRRAGARGLF